MEATSAPGAGSSEQSREPAPNGDSAEWLQWGGPHRDFRSAAVGLADSWPSDGPRRLWARDLGEGYSGIVVDGERLFTMYRSGGRELVVAMSAESGETLWESDYEASVRGLDTGEGSGPHASPLVVGDRLFTVGVVGDLRAFDKRTGEPLWSVDLWGDLRGTFRPRGYSSSPIAYDDTVIVPVGGRGQAVVAFDQADGSVVWRGGNFDNAQASPIIIDVDGQPQLVAFLVDAVAGFDPATGELLWRHRHHTDYGLNISTPVWGDDNVLFISSAYSGGSRALRLTLDGEVTRVEELWYTNRLRVHFGNAIRIGDHIYGANGDFGPSFVTALDMEDGSVIWRDRSFAKASFVLADNKLILLDEDGVLGLVQVSAAGMEVLSSAEVFDSLSWTAPTLAGTTLYLRNHDEIAAFDLSISTNGES
jgi:outer membrane protein assembly factor BamB